MLLKLSNIYCLKIQWNSVKVLKTNICNADKLLDIFIKYLDVFSHFIGPILIFLVISIISWVTVIFYLFFLSEVFLWKKIYAILSITIGHYLLLMICYYYYMALTTTGFPFVIENYINFFYCKKCNNIKPERTHHCSLCNRCILKMDHHCPWLNTCVGHFNHCHFYLFMIFSMLGCYFVSFITYPYFITYIIADFKWIAKFIPNIHHSKKFNNIRLHRLLKLEFEPQEINYELFRESSLNKNVIAIEFLLPLATGTSLLLLALWHGFLITRGETSIEFLNNRDKRKQYENFMKDYTAEPLHKFVNPYNYGYLNNWKILFGSNHLKGILWNIFVPDVRLLYHKLNNCHLLNRYIHRSIPKRKLRNNRVIGDGYNWTSIYITYFLKHRIPPPNKELYNFYQSSTFTTQNLEESSGLLSHPETCPAPNFYFQLHEHSNSSQTSQLSIDVKHI